jgi:hypothetical protein
MSMQLTFDFTSKPQREQTSVIQDEDWLDVSDIARGVGFTTAVQVGISLHEAIRPLQNEIDGNYDQRLYDALWMAHFKLSLENSQFAAFRFTFPRKDRKTGEDSEISLRVRAVTQKQVVRVGLLQDFSEAV